MDLREAIIQGGRQWKTAYPLICAAAVEALAGVEKQNPFTTRELQDAILEMVDLPDDYQNRTRIYRCITANTKPGLDLVEYFDRRSVQDGHRTKQAWVWHDRVPLTVEQRRAVIQADIDALQVTLDGIV